MNALPQEGDDRFKRAGKGGFGSVFRRIVDNNQYACKVTKLDVDNLEDDTQKAKLYSAVNELYFASIISDKCGSDPDNYKATPFFYLDHPVYHTFEVQEYEGEIIADYKDRLKNCIDSYELYSSDYAFLGEEILNNKIQYFIEEKGAYVEKQLNSKILQLRAEYYIDLIVALEPEESRDKLIKRLKTEFKDSGKEDVVFDERNIGRSLLEAAVNVSALAANISGAVSPSNMVGAALIKLLTR